MRIKMPYDDNPLRIKLSIEQRDRLIEALQGRLAKEYEKKDKRLINSYLKLRRSRANKEYQKYLSEKTHTNILYEYLFAKSTISAFILLCSVSLYNAFPRFIGYDISYLANAIIVILGGALAVNVFALFLRITGNVFCNNGYEAQEFIAFILKNTKDKDYNDTSGGKPSFPDDMDLQSKEKEVGIHKWVVAR